MSDVSDKNMSFIERALLVMCNAGDAVSKSYVEDSSLAQGCTHILDGINDKTKKGLDDLNARFQYYVANHKEMDGSSNFDPNDDKQSSRFSQHCSDISNQIQQYQKEMDIQKNDANSNVNRTQDMASRDSTSQQNFNQWVSPIFTLIQNGVSALGSM